MTIPLQEQLAEVRREIALRERVYPRWISQGKLEPTKAQRKLATLRAVADTLARLAKAEELPLEGEGNGGEGAE